MHQRPNYLFEGTSAYDLVQHLQTRAMDELKGKNEDALLTTPIDDLLTELINSFTLYVPQLRDSDTWVDEKEVNKTVRFNDYDFYTDQRGGRRTIISHTVIFHVPFEGDGSLFKITPSARSLPGPEADIKSQELVISIATDQKTSDQVRQEYEQRIVSIKEHLSRLEGDLRPIPTNIESAARPWIEQRKSQILKSKNLVSSLGFPMKRRAEAQMTYKAPEIRRKLTPAKTPTVTPFMPEPALDEAQYLHILSVMDNMTKVMERSPHTFEKMGEEDIRQHFLVQLNGQYEGQATGETFNFEGKTDILIRSEGRNIFIAECKFWRGEKVFLETVDQLLSYLSWRDSKTAIVIFNKNKNTSGVVETIKQAMQKHPHKKRGPKVDSETRFRFVMGNPGDPSREIIMSVMIYDIPVSG
jgi:hypothetical protein